MLVEDATQNCFDLLHEECRVYIFKFLTFDDLDKASATSRRFCDYCRHPSLLLGQAMQNPTAIVRVVTANEDVSLHPFVRVARCFGAMASDDTRRIKFEHFSRFKILHSSLLVEGEPSRLDGLYSRRLPIVPIPQITSLDMSTEPSSSLEPVESATEKAMVTFIAWMLPNLRALDVSHWKFRNISLRWISEHCKNLEQLAWRGHHFGDGLSGYRLSHFPNLREVNMDGACFNGGGQVNTVSVLYDEHYEEEFLFHRISDRVERVSIKNARYKNDGMEPTSIPQEGLAKFVRHARNLRWFRSDLTPSNIEMLRQELLEQGRPEITFES
jgi:hypothetical protein